MNTTTVFLWVAIAAFVLPAFFFGIKKIRVHPESLADFERWGYSKTFMVLLGIVEALAGVGLLFDTTRLFSIYVYAIILLGAIGTHLLKDKPKDALPPIFVGILLALIYFLQS